MLSIKMFVLDSFFNSLTLKSILAGMKNSHSDGFWLAKHTSHKHPRNVMEPFPPPVAWF